MSDQTVADMRRTPIVTPLGVARQCPLCDRPYVHAVLLAEVVYDVCVPCGVRMVRRPIRRRVES